MKNRNPAYVPPEMMDVFYNRISLIGTLSEDPPVFNIMSNGIEAITFLIHQRYWFGGKIKIMDIRCKAYSTIAEYIHKSYKPGELVLIEGQLHGKFVRQKGIHDYSVVADRIDLIKPDDGEMLEADVVYSPDELLRVKRDGDDGDDGDDKDNEVY